MWLKDWMFTAWFVWLKLPNPASPPVMGSRLCARLFFVPSVDIGGALTIHMVLIRAESLSL